MKIIFVLFYILNTNVSFATNKIASEIHFFEGLNLVEFNEQYSFSRKNLRRDFLYEVSGLTYWGYFPGEGFDIIKYFDDMVTNNRDRAKTGLSKSLSSEFRSYLQNLYEYHQPSQGERIQFIPDVNSPVDFLIQGLYTIESVDRIRASLFIVNLEEGSSFSIAATGNYITVGQRLAQSLFDFFHKSKFPMEVKSSYGSSFEVLIKAFVPYLGSPQKESFAYDQARRNCSARKAQLASESQFLDILSKGKYHGGWSLNIRSSHDKHWAIADNKIFDASIQSSKLVNYSNNLDQLSYFCVKAP